MNVFELAHQVNNRLNDRDESKFLVTFTVVNEFLSSYKIFGPLFLKCFPSIISEGDFGEKIMLRINTFENLKGFIMYDNEDELSMLIHLQSSFAFDRRASEITSFIMKVFETVVFLGSAFAIGRMVRGLTSS